MIKGLCLLAVVVLIHQGSGLSRQVSFPLKSVQHTEYDFQQMKIAFQDVVESSDFFVQTSPSQIESSICSVPVLGDHIEVKLQASDSYDQSAQAPAEFVLSVEGSASGNDEFGWICVKFYESKELFQDIVDTSDLRTAVVDHFNSQPPHPGFQASSAKLAGSRQIDDLFDDKESAMSELDQEGFIVLDDGPKSSKNSLEQLTQFLLEKTNQGTNVRTDTVHFLSRDEAKTCGFTEHFDALMGIASFLNGNLNFLESPHAPMGPATADNPLTIPNSVQLAEYGENGFYKAHSDNSLTDRFINGDRNNGHVRHNFRHYTCILYCNDDWGEIDGGALRLYPKTQNLLSAEDAIHQGCGYIDVSPENGRLIIFDACLIHSVERVTHKTKKRRALTLWINRPDDSGVQGENFF